MNGRRIKRCLRLLALIGIGGTAAAAEDSDLAWGRFAWENGSFEDASARLSAFRTRAGKSPNHAVDYMLATSWCRMHGMQDKGAALLDWLVEQKVAAALRPQAVQERRICADAADSRPSPIQMTGKGATIKSQGNNPTPKKRVELPA